MRCPRCGHDNAAGLKFCGDCGARLATACPACGALNAPAQKFCGQCGTPLGPAAPAPVSTAPATYTPRHLAEKILTSRSALEGERLRRGGRSLPGGAGRRWEEAATALGRARETAQAVGNPPQLWRTHLALGRLHAARGDPGAARAAYLEAHATVTAVARRLGDVGLRQSLLRSPMVREIEAGAAG